MANRLSPVTRSLDAALRPPSGTTQFLDILSRSLPSRLPLSFRQFRKLAAALLAASALTHPVTARAQQETRSQLQAQTNSTITTNGRGSITGSVLNNLLNNILSSVLFGGDAADSLTVGGNSLGVKLANVHSILESGAACNGVANPSVDDGPQLAAWFATLAPGTIVYLPAGAFCSILSANITLPNGVRFIGATNVGYVNTGADPSGSGSSKSRLTTSLRQPIFSTASASGDLPLTGITILRPTARRRRRTLPSGGTNGRSGSKPSLPRR